MATYEYNKELSFILPAGFKFLRETDDEGNEKVHISSGEYRDDEGEVKYKFNCVICLSEYEIEDDVDDKEKAVKELLDSAADCLENAKKIKLTGIPEAYILSKAMPMSVWGQIIKMFGCILLVRTTELSIAQIVSTGQINDDEPEDELEVYKNMYEIMKSVRVNGKKLNVEGITPQKMRKVLEPVFDDNEEARDISPTIKFVFDDGEGETTFEMNGNGMTEAVTRRLTEVTPDESRYPEYNSINRMSFLSFLGASVNSTGTEYAFYPLSSYDEDGENSDVCKRIVAKDTEKYDLHQKAKEMQKLFRVNESVFDSQHDRECELEHSLMHRAYMMSALRSFAWTLADYCKQYDCSPEDLTEEKAIKISDFVLMHNYLNYDGETYCTGLCSGSDLHVYFIPDSVSQADRK